MSKEVKTMPGVEYCATMTKAGHVYGVEDGGGQVLLRESDRAQQLRFQAISGLVVVDDDEAVVLPVRELPPGVVLEDGVQAEQVAEMVRGGVDEAVEEAAVLLDEYKKEVQYRHWKEVEVWPYGVDQTSEDNYHAYGFEAEYTFNDHPIVVAGLKLWCREGGSAEPGEGVPVWLKVWRWEANGWSLLARSKNGCVHVVGGVLEYELEPFELSIRSDSLHVTFHREEDLATEEPVPGVRCCVRSLRLSRNGGMLGSNGQVENSSWVAKHVWQGKSDPVKFLASQMTVNQDDERCSLSFGGDVVVMEGREQAGIGVQSGAYQTMVVLTPDALQLTLMNGDSITAVFALGGSDVFFGGSPNGQVYTISGAEVNNHVKSEAIHITAEERAKWDAAAEMAPSAGSNASGEPMSDKWLLYKPHFHLLFTSKDEVITRTSNGKTFKITAVWRETSEDAFDMTHAIMKCEDGEVSVSEAKAVVAGYSDMYITPLY